LTGIVLSAVGPVAPAAAQISRTALTPRTVVISNVGLVPMTSDTLIRGTTVLIRDGRIAAVTVMAASGCRPEHAESTDGGST
jgi:imidazolonepropionase-like amidohydrolase